MTKEAEVDRLLETLLESEQTPEEACAESPGLLPAVRQRLLQFQLLKQELQTIFPSSSPDKNPLRRDPIGGLPTIPGYVIDSVLGRGGMGVVYQARQQNLNRPVALKMLLAGVCATSGELVRFMREAQAIAALRHTNIVQIYDIGDCDGRAYFTMELLDGGTLRQSLNGKPQPIRSTADLVLTLAKAMEFAHQAGVVHRDLKPGNILLTAQGIPKIADFGLARDDNAAEELTLSGAPLGTPSYMAPEQALGKHQMVGPTTDIYALGVIIYEMLTGRPPFLAESAIETQRLLIEQDPIAPSRLNPRIPRDLETICIKCLQKQPDRRYASAAELAADLDRFTRGEPIHARPIGAIERLAKWTRRRPAVATAIIGATLFTAASLAGAMWLQVQRDHRQAAAENDLRNVAAFESAGHWSDATATLTQAEARLGWDSFTGVRSEIERARSDLALVMRVDRIRMNRMTGGALEYYRIKADRDYLNAFHTSGLATIGDLPAIAAKRIAASPIRAALLAALDDWAVFTTETARRDWLLQISQRVAADQNWRSKLIAHGSWKNRKNVEQLAEAIPINRDSITLLLGLSERTESADRDFPQYLLQLQEQNPADFWTNLVLGNALLQQKPASAEGYYRAALAARPEAAVGYDAVGDSLRLQRRFSEALDYYHKALGIEPDYPRAVSNLAGALAGLGKSDEAIATYRRALVLDPNYAWAHYGMANAMRDANHFADAEAEYRIFLASRSINTDALNSLRRVQIRQGRIDQVWKDWQQTLSTHPQKFNAWAGAAELALFLKDQPGYARIRSELLARFGDNAAASDDLIRTCLLCPDSSDEIHKVAADYAGKEDPTASPLVENRALAKFDKGLSQYRLGQWDAAIATLSTNGDRSFENSNQLVIAMALMRKGKPTEARQILADAIAHFDWSPANADRREVWICHILRREAEPLLLPTAKGLATHADFN